MTYRPRIIPVLLLKDGGLVKSVKFKDYTYIGDPINAVKIFNELYADELIFLDISATQEGRTISAELVRSIGEEANMPFCVGGGIRTQEDILKLIQAGAEKVILGSVAAKNPDFVRQASLAFGSSTISVCMDVKKDIWGRQKVWIENGKKAQSSSPQDFARQMEDHGAGELVVQSIQRDGTMTGYDLELLHTIADRVSIPVTALGGAAGWDDMKQTNKELNINGLAAGSIFVFQGIHRGVLIQYPTLTQKEIIFNGKA